MKFSVSSATLLTHLQTVSRVINSKNTLPILDNFLFDLQGDKLTITAADMETTLVTSVVVNNPEGSGIVALSAKILLDTLKEFSDEPLEFHIDDDNYAMTITSNANNGIYNFVGLNADEFPKMRDLEAENHSLEVPASVLGMGITSTIFATSDDEMRPIMSGILFEVSPTNLTFVATDGYKLVRVKSSNVKCEENCSFVLPKKPISLLKAILPKEAGNVLVKFDKKNVYFELSNYKMVCRLIEGNYPDYNKVIPTDNPNKVTIDRSSFLNALRRISVYASQSTSLVKLDLDEGHITCSAQDFDFSISANESLSCSYEGTPMSIGFKSSILIDMLNNLSSDNVLLELSNSVRQGLLSPLEQNETEDVLMLLSPMQT